MISHSSLQMKIGLSQEEKIIKLSEAKYTPRNEEPSLRSERQPDIFTKTMKQ